MTCRICNQPAHDCDCNVYSQVEEQEKLIARFLSLYDSGELTTEALRELACEMRKVVG